MIFKPALRSLLMNIYILASYMQNTTHPQNHLMIQHSNQPCQDRVETLQELQRLSVSSNHSKEALLLYYGVAKRGGG